MKENAKAHEREVHSDDGVVIEKTRSKKKRAVTRRRGPEETEQESLLPRFHTTFVDSICETMRRASRRMSVFISRSA